MAKFPRVVDHEKLNAEREARREAAWQFSEESQRRYLSELERRVSSQQDEERSGIRRRFPHSACQD